MDLIKEYTAFDRKVSEFSFSMEKEIGSRGQEVIYMALAVPGYADLEAETTSCPAVVMCDLMAKHLKRLAAAQTAVVLKPRKKILIVR